MKMNAKLVCTAKRPPAPQLPGRRKGFVYKVPGGFQRIYVSKSSGLGREIRSDRERNGYSLYFLGHTHHTLWVEDDRAEILWLRPLQNPAELDLFADVAWKHPKRFLHDAQGELVERVWASAKTEMVKDQQCWLYAVCLGKAKETKGVMVVRSAIELDDDQVKALECSSRIMALSDDAAMPWEEAV